MGSAHRSVCVGLQVQHTLRLTPSQLPAQGRERLTDVAIDGMQLRKCDEHL